MQAYMPEDLKLRTSELQEAAKREPIIIIDDGRPGWVMMSMQDFDRLNGRRRGRPSIVELPDEMVDRFEVSASAEDDSAA